VVPLERANSSYILHTLNYTYYTEKWPEKPP